MSIKSHPLDHCLYVLFNDKAGAFVRECEPRDMLMDYVEWALSQCGRDLRLTKTSFANQFRIKAGLPDGVPGVGCQLTIRGDLCAKETLIKYMAVENSPINPARRDPTAITLETCLADNIQAYFDQQIWPGDRGLYQNAIQVVAAGEPFALQ